MYYVYVIKGKSTVECLYGTSQEIKARLEGGYIVCGYYKGVRLNKQTLTILLG